MSDSSLFSEAVWVAVVFVCLDGRGGTAQLDRKVSSTIAGLWSRFSSAAADDSGITGDEEAESV